MQYKKAQKNLTNVWTYVIILFISGMIVYMLTAFGNNLVDSEHENLDNSSIEYLAVLNNIDLDEYNTSVAQREQLQGQSTGNESEGTDNDKDFALDFFFGREKSQTIEGQIRNVFNLPSTTISIIFFKKANAFSWFYVYMNWLFWLAIFLAIIYFVRNR